MGLLDFLQGDDARLGMSLLAAGGPSTTPMSVGQRFSGALQSVSAQKDADMKNLYVKSQIDENNSQISARQMQAQRDAQINAIVAARLGGVQMSPSQGAGGGSPMTTGAPSLPDVPGAAGGVGGAGGGFGAGAPPRSSTGGALPMLGQNPGTQSTQGLPGAQGAPSSFPFSMNDIALLGTAGSKNVGMLFDMYKYNKDGVKREAGNSYMDPVTGATKYYPKVDNGMTVDAAGNVTALPGYSSANAGIKGAETGAVESAKLPYTVAANRESQFTTARLDTHPVVNENGDLEYVPRSTIAGTGAGGGGMGAPGGAGNAFGGVGVAPGGTVGLNGAPRFMASRNPVTQNSAIALNDNWIKSTYQPTLDAGKTAGDLQASIQSVRNINMNTGWGTENKAAAAAMLEGLGINIGSSKLYAENAQKFQSVAMDKLLSTLAAQKGTQTEGDSTRAQQTFVKLSNTPNANAFITDFAQAKANMDQRRAQFYEQALPLAQKSGDLTRVDREWRKIQGSIWADPILQNWSK